MNTHCQLAAVAGTPLAVAAMFFACSTAALAAPAPAAQMEPGEAMLANANGAKAARIAAILDRWQPAAISIGQNAVLWRDVMSIETLAAA